MNTHYIFHALLALLLVTSAATSAQSVAYFLDIPDIPGNVTMTGYEDQICITSFSYGVSTTDGSGRVSGAVEQLAFRLGKTFDVASPLLFSSCTGRMVLDRVTFTTVVTNPEDGSQQPLAEYEMDNVVIVSYQTGGSTDDPGNEVIVLRPERITISHFEADGSETTTFYDFESGTGG
jgi:type VI secretion system Hcp family effector